MVDRVDTYADGTTRLWADPPDGQITDRDGTVRDATADELADWGALQNEFDRDAERAGLTQSLAAMNAIIDGTGSVDADVRKIARAVKRLIRAQRLDE